MDDDEPSYRTRLERRVAELEEAAAAVIRATEPGGHGTIRLPDRDSTRALLAALAAVITPRLL